MFLRRFYCRRKFKPKIVNFITWRLQERMLFLMNRISNYQLMLMHLTEHGEKRLDNNYPFAVTKLNKKPKKGISSVRSLNWSEKFGCFCMRVNKFMAPIRAIEAKRRQKRETEMARKRFKNSNHSAFVSRFGLPAIRFDSFFLFSFRPIENSFGNCLSMKSSELAEDAEEVKNVTISFDHFDSIIIRE